MRTGRQKPDATAGRDVIIRGLVINAESIASAHDEVVEEFGGQPGFRDRASLEYICYHTGTLLKKLLTGGESDLFECAGYFLHSIVTKHPFWDGNKRTGIIVSKGLLAQFGFSLEASEDEMVAFLVDIGSYKKARGYVKKWLEKHSRTELKITRMEFGFGKDEIEILSFLRRK